jgi:hypothetical protein
MVHNWYDLYLNKCLSVLSVQYQNRKLLFCSTFYLHSNGWHVSGAENGPPDILWLPSGIWFPCGPGAGFSTFR